MKGSATREAARQLMRRRMTELAVDAGQRRAVLPDELLEYLAGRPSAEQCLGLLEAYVSGVTGLPLRASVSERARRTTVQNTQDSPPSGGFYDHES